MKKIIDERQELEMMKVERTGFWIMWGVLLLSLLGQSLFLGAGPKQIAGENISFLVGCLIVVIGCVKKGLWGYDSTPCMKTYLSASLIGTLIFTFYSAQVSHATALNMYCPFAPCLPSVFSF